MIQLLSHYQFQELRWMPVDPVLLEIAFDQEGKAVPRDIAITSAKKAYYALR